MGGDQRGQSRHLAHSYCDVSQAALPALLSFPGFGLAAEVRGRREAEGARHSRRRLWKHLEIEIVSGHEAAVLAWCRRRVSSSTGNASSQVPEQAVA